MAETGPAAGDLRRASAAIVHGICCTRIDCLGHLKQLAAQGASSLHYQGETLERACGRWSRASHGGTMFRRM